MNDRTRALAEALTSTTPQIRVLVMQIESLEPGAIERLATALRLDRVMTPKTS